MTPYEMHPPNPRPGEPTPAEIRAAREADRPVVYQRPGGQTEMLPPLPVELYRGNPGWVSIQVEQIRKWEQVAPGRYNPVTARIEATVTAGDYCTGGEQLDLAALRELHAAIGEAIAAWEAAL